MRGAGSPARGRVPHEGRGRDGSVLKLVRRCRSLSSPPWLGIPESEPSFPMCDESANRRAERSGTLCTGACCARRAASRCHRAGVYFRRHHCICLAPRPPGAPAVGRAGGVTACCRGEALEVTPGPGGRTQLGSKPRATPRFTGSARISWLSLHLIQGWRMSGTRPSTPDRPRPSPPGPAPHDPAVSGGRP